MNPRSSDARIARRPSKEKLNLYLSNIRRELQSANLSASTMQASLDFAEELVERNSIKDARILIEEVRNSIYRVADQATRSRLRKSFYSLKGRLDQFGKKFDFTGLLSVDGKRWSKENREDALKLVVVWSLKDSDSIALVEQIHRLKKDFTRRNIEVVAICQLDEDERQTNRFKQIADENESLEFLTFGSEDFQSRQFSDRFPVPKFPYLVMLSADDRVAGLNLHPVFFDPVSR